MPKRTEQTKKYDVKLSMMHFADDDGVNGRVVIYDDGKPLIQVAIKLSKEHIVVLECDVPNLKVECADIVVVVFDEDAIYDITNCLTDETIPAVPWFPHDRRLAIDVALRDFVKNIRVCNSEWDLANELRDGMRKVVRLAKGPPLLH